MARRKKGDVIKVFNVQLSNVDRTYKGIDEWRNALKSAESIVNPRRKRLYDLYREIVLDPHLSAVMEKRRLNVSNTPVVFFDKSGKENEAVNRIMQMPFFTRMIEDIIDTRFWGHTLMYFNHLTPDYVDYQIIPREHVVPERGIVVKQVYDDTGIPYHKPPYSRYTIPVGQPKDLGLMLKAAPFVIYKKGDIADWSIYAQVFGTPFRKMTYDGHDIETKNKLEEIAQNTGTAQYMVIPKQADLELIESNGKSGSSDLYKALAEFCDKQNSKLILGNTMTTDAEGGNYKGEVHQEVEWKFTQADKRLALNVLNTQFTKILDNFGIPTEGGYFAFDEPDLLTLDDYLKLSKEIPFDEDFFYEKYNIPKPKKATKKSQEKAPKKEDEKKVNNNFNPANEQYLNENLSEELNLFQRFLSWLNLAKKKSLSQQVTELYPAIQLADAPLFDSKGLISEALQNIYSGVTPPDGVDPKLWQLSFQELNKAVDEGFGRVQFGHPDFDFTEQLKVNNGVFSAFKNHGQTKELVNLLRDEKGNLKSFSKFRKDSESIIWKYNKNYLRVEYNTGVRKARSAANWKKFEKTKDLYPNLEYLPSRSADPRPEHVPFYHTVLPMDHPWWAGHTPPLAWECKCGFTNTDREETKTPSGGGEIVPGLDNNPVFTKKLFSSSHPYETRLKRSKRISLSKKAMGIERKMLLEWGKNKLRGKVYNASKHSATMSGRNIKEWLNQPHKNYAYKNRLLLELEDVLQEATFIKTVENKTGGDFARQFHYYRVTLQGEPSYIVLRELENGQVEVYSMVDKIKESS